MFLLYIRQAQASTSLINDGHVVIPSVAPRDCLGVARAKLGKISNAAPVFIPSKGSNAGERPGRCQCSPLDYEPIRKKILYWSGHTNTVSFLHSCMVCRSFISGNLHRGRVSSESRWWGSRDLELKGEHKDMGHMFIQVRTVKVA
jgi:hypothetical protein